MKGLYTPQLIVTLDSYDKPPLLHRLRSHIVRVLTIGAIEIRFQWNKPEGHYVSYEFSWAPGVGVMRWGAKE